MRRFRILFVIFAVALLAPLAMLVHRAQRSAALERQMRHQAVAERAFDEMERGLSRVLEGEEEQSFERYGRGVEPSHWPFVVGHFQIDPDGRVQALAAEAATGESARRAELETVVGAYWRSLDDAAPSEPPVGRIRGVAPPAGPVPAQEPGTTVAIGRRAQPPAPVREKDADQDDVSAFDALRSLNKAVGERQRKADYGASESSPAVAGVVPGSDSPLRVDEASREGRAARDDALRAQAEFAPMVGRIIDDRHLMLFRTVVRKTRGYRQGVLIDVGQLGDWLRTQGLGSDGVAEYASVSFATRFDSAAAAEDADAFVYLHRFAEPFDDLQARFALRLLPGADNVTYVFALGALLLTTGVLGLAALYRMVSVVVNFAERRSNFVAAVSHELKTPLTAIRMYGEMLRDGLVPSEAKRDEYYRHITVESERLSRLINNVLEFARLEKGNREIALTTGSVVPVVREVAALMRPHVEGQGFALHVDVDDAVPPVRLERDALMQVLWNLVDNAVKYARDAAQKRIVLRCWRDGAGVHVAVRDHGPGVAPSHLGKIFEPFYRGESELTRRGKGTGLGLALVRGLVERMGARVSGHNVADGGFEVDIVFCPMG